MAERLGVALLELGTDDRRLIKGIARARASARRLGENRDLNAISAGHHRGPANCRTIATAAKF